MHPYPNGVGRRRLLTVVKQKYREWKGATKRLSTWFAATFEGRHSTEVSSHTIRRRKHLSHTLFYFIFTIAIGSILVDQGPRVGRQPILKEGQIAEQDWISPLTAEIEPKESRKKNKDELAKKIAPIFDYDDRTTENWLKRWESAFKKARQQFYTGKNKKISVDIVSQFLLEQTGQSLPSSEVLYLHQKKFSQETENAFTKIGEYFLGRLIAPFDLFPSYYATGIIVRQINQDLNETLIYDLSRIWSLEQAREFLEHIPTVMKVPKSHPANRLSVLMSHILISNLELNSVMTEKRVSNLLGLTKPVVHSVKKGQVIVKRGERVSEKQAEITSSLQELLSPTATIQRFLLTSLSIFVFLMILFRMELTKKGFWHLSLKDSIVFMVMTLITLFLAKYTLPYLRLAFGSLNFPYGAEFLMPLSAGGLIIHLTMGKEVAFTFALLISLLCGYMFDKNYFYSLWVFTVSTSAIQSIKACKQRTDLYKCGAWSGAIGGVLVAAYSLNQIMGFRSLEAIDFIVPVVCAVMSGMLAAILAGSLIPVMESLLGYTTSLKLLELSNFNHPLLHSLMMKAPGTYHHSVIVGSLAEIAADRVKANALLARVAAYYHDIGKMSTPLYFIENQSLNNNPHDHLAPSMSAKILFAHVKNGAKMAREHNLGGKITHIIEQHHGTTLVSYFFNKAKKMENPEHDHVSSSEFRYPGPRPQSREAAIVMLADACEAATRSINEPTGAKIQSMVHSIINKRSIEEQFAECDLTFNDLQIIEESFTRTLVSLYHHRIEYPGQKQQPATRVPQAPQSLKKGA